MTTVTAVTSQVKSLSAFTLTRHRHVYRQSPSFIQKAQRECTKSWVRTTEVCPFLIQFPSALSKPNAVGCTTDQITQSSLASSTMIHFSLYFVSVDLKFGKKRGLLPTISLREENGPANASGTSLSMSARGGDISYLARHPTSDFPLFAHMPPQ